MKTERELRKMIDQAYTLLAEIDAGERPGFFGMSYEEGVKAALDWVLGNTDTSPLDE